MKRVSLSIIGTALGLVALLSFKSRGHPIAAAGDLPSAGLPVAISTSTPAGPAASGAPPGSGTPAESTTATAGARALDQAGSK